jgi:hypothetical protein
MEANRRRRSVAFAVAENPRSARSSRRSAAEETTDSDVAAAAPATGVRKEAPASAQAAPSWVKKRRKVDTTAGAAGAGQAGAPSSAAASAADISTPAPAASRDRSALADTVRIAAAVAAAPVAPAVAAMASTPAAADPAEHQAAAPPPSVRRTVPAAPPSPPSMLASVPSEVLHALLEVCDEFTADEHARRLPNMDLALHACRMELQRLGVTHAPPPNEAAVRLSATESQLAARVHDLEAALRQWDAAAAPASAPVPTPAGALEAQNANASVLSLLPEVPPIHAQLAELGVLASLCTAQVGSVVQQTMEVARRARKEREQLGRAANQFIFRDYMHVDEPKGLIKGLLG